MTTSPFMINLTRWDSKRGERRISKARILAMDFAHAVQMANVMVRASGEADPDRTYEIAGVSQDGFHNAIECEHGWMTYEEWAEANGLRQNATGEGTKS